MIASASAFLFFCRTRSGNAVVRAPLQALGEEPRVRIVELLIDRPLAVEDIALALGVSQYNVSKHLRILHGAELLVVEKDARQRRYGLPTAISRKVDSDGSVLDLGCCCFQFSQRPRRSASATAARRPTATGVLVPFPARKRSTPD